MRVDTHTLLNSGTFKRYYGYREANALMFSFLSLEDDAEEINRVIQGLARMAFFALKGRSAQGQEWQEYDQNHTVFAIEYHGVMVYIQSSDNILYFSNKIDERPMQ